ncbi:hypothetical protein ACFX5E_13880 [Flavobacterium sp. LS2P90]|uniref:Uncharacterized protein n=1 Tax=Flavobacterium xylosi TaxID=3230415 RepID=A0ABW6HYR3_9FLAO
MSLTEKLCFRHPLGNGKGKDMLYEGPEKAQYFCKYCGAISSSILSLKSFFCPQHPKGNCQGRHLPFFQNVTLL